MPSYRMFTVKLESERFNRLTSLSRQHVMSKSLIVRRAIDMFWDEYAEDVEAIPAPAIEIPLPGRPKGPNAAAEIIAMWEVDREANREPDPFYPTTEEEVAEAWRLAGYKPDGTLLDE